MTEKTLAPPIQVTWPMVVTVLGGVSLVILASMGGLLAVMLHLDGQQGKAIQVLTAQVSEIKESVARLDERLTSHMEGGHE